MTPEALEQFARLADSRLDRVRENDLPVYNAIKDQIFGSAPLDKAWWEGYGVGTLGDIPEWHGKYQALSQAPGYYVRIEPKEFGAMVGMTRKMRDDKQYRVFDNRQDDLISSFGRTKEKYAAKVFNYGFSATWDFMTSEEGVSICSSSHTTKSGVSTTTGFDNSGTSPLSKTSLAATRLLARKFKNDRGNYMNLNFDTVVGPAALEDTFYEVVGYDPRSGASSSMDPSSANGKINIVNRAFRYIPWLLLDDYSTTNWFLIDSSMAKRHLLWIDRIAAETKTRIDWDTEEIQSAIYGRFGWGCDEWRWIYGHSVS